MIIFLSGKDSYRSRQHLKKMVTKFKVDRDPQGLNVVEIDCMKAKSPDVWQQILASPFLAERRMVVLERLLSSKLKDVQESLLERMKEGKLPDSTVLIIWEDTDTWRAKLPKTLAKELNAGKFSQVFEPLAGAKLTAWVRSAFSEHGTRVSHDALSYLTRHIGTDMWKLSSTINQLVSWAGDDEVSVDAVKQFVDPHADDNIFTLVDAIIAGNTAHVFNMMAEQRRQGKDALYILAMVLRQVKILLTLRDLFERNGRLPGGEMAKVLGLHPFVLKKSGGMVKKYTKKQLQSMYTELLDIDRKVKSGQGSQQVLLDLFVGRVAAQG